ncbi:MAG: hypothetical protein HC856_04560 [Pseudanabaena sp. RU_4_16]|nr:hypothetical protein [Pseudanabaena sp. RU_4_16]
MTDTKIESLWPDDFGPIEVIPPVAILRQQAYILGQKTRNILEGEVSSQPSYIEPPIKPHKRTNDAVAGTLSLKVIPSPLFAASSTEDSDFEDDEIIHMGDKLPNALRHSFYIKAPALGGYRYRLFSASHKAVSIYPLSIYFDGKTGGVADEEGLRDALRDIFASESTKKVIQALMLKASPKLPASDLVK